MIGRVADAAFFRKRGKFFAVLQRVSPDRSFRTPDFASTKTELSPNARDRFKDADAVDKAAGLSGHTPGYVWHHHEEYGRMQLVDEEAHGKTGHKGGWDVWGQYGPESLC